jgi:hypothetical protein
VSDIEISEADEQRFERLSSRLTECFSTQSVKYAVEEQRRIWLEELASHRLAATTAVEARVADQLQKAREACDIAFHVICHAIKHGMPITKNVADARNMTAEVYREWQAELQPTPEPTT